jgi:hypothetical protein
LGEFAQHRAVGRYGARASMRAAFVELDTLTITSMLPGISAHYLAMLCALECRIAQLQKYYV